jgi:hypothetical protein
LRGEEVKVELAGYTEDELRARILSMTEGVKLHWWCRCRGLSQSHVWEFLAGKRPPPRDLLNVLGLCKQVRYVECE